MRLNWYTRLNGVCFLWTECSNLKINYVFVHAFELDKSNGTYFALHREIVSGAGDFLTLDFRRFIGSRIPWFLGDCALCTGSGLDAR